MLKIVHLLAGLVAVLLSFTPMLSPEAEPFLQNASALCLTLLGLSNLLFAPQLPIWHDGARQHAQSLVSAFLLVSTLLQGLILLAPLSTIANYPAELVSLSLVTLAVAVHLATNLRINLGRKLLSQNTGDRESGTVKWFNTSKGFGFISRDSGDDIFVHFRAIRGEGHRVLIEGQRVEFSVMQRDKGLQAEDVVATPQRR
ncbi:cold-shock protein [Pseudomonas sp. TTU2014-080ASC]|nr:cold-shock protein [Pseudomonas sp. TTU2014-080ASC]